jgi:hypothetical protein
MNHKLSNILYTTNKSRINNQFDHDYIVYQEKYHDPLIDPYENWYEQPFPFFYKNFALDIVAETVFNYPQPYISEKVFRPILAKRMFIYVGPAHSLKFLRQFGFKTFSNFINEDYDSIENSTERMKSIEKEIEKFSKKTINEVKDIIINSTNILEHNFLVLSHLYDVELENIKKQIDNPQN